MTARSSNSKVSARDIKQWQATWPNINIEPRLPRSMQGNKLLEGEGLQDGQRRYLHSVCSIYSLDYTRYQLRAAAMNRLKKAYFLEYPGCDDFMRYAKWILHPHKQLFVVDRSVFTPRGSGGRSNRSNASSKQSGALLQRPKIAAAKRKVKSGKHEQNEEDYSEDFVSESITELSKSKSSSRSSRSQDSRSLSSGSHVVNEDDEDDKPNEDDDD